MITEAARRCDALTSDAVAVVMQLVPPVDSQTAAAAVGEAAQTSAALHGMLEHLCRHPDALSTGSSDAPNAVIKLAHALRNRGIAGVVPPGCAVCGRVVLKMRRIAGKGGACHGCYLDSRRRACSGCGKIARIVSSKDEREICNACHLSDPNRRELCVGCGKPRRVAHRDDQRRPRCARCYPRPRRACSSCGAITETAAFTEAGPVCPRCYVHPKRECGRCGRVRSISSRATDQTPDLCYSCDRGPEDTCSHCGRRGPRKGYRNGKPICERCHVQPRCRCDFCGEVGRITARWPTGSVCSVCYPKIRAKATECPGCAQSRTLTEIDDRGRHVCAECAGSGPHYRCARCGGTSDGYVRDRCAPCALQERLDDLLSTADREIRPELRGIHQSLTRWRNPRSVLSWLDRSAGAQILGDLARKHGDLTHADLDDQPRGRFTNHIRQALVHAGALPHRDESIEHVEKWLDEFLTTTSTAHSQILRPFATWVVLRRARQRGRRKPTTEAAASWARQRIRVAADLLTHLDGLGVRLQALDQRTLDQWLASGNSTRHTVRDFTKWTVRQRLTTQLAVPLRQVINPEEPLADDRWQQLRGCLREQQLPLRLRVSGAFLLLYGHQVSRIVAIRAGQIEEHGTAVYLKTGEHRGLLPPALAKLVLQLRDATPPASILRSRSDTTDWLFPGLVPGQHLADSYLVRLLNDRGIRTRAARNSALISLAADLPAPILADLLDLHVNTAVRWVRRSKRDWASYVEARAEAKTPACDDLARATTRPVRARRR